MTVLDLSSPVGIVAGGGALPRTLAASLKDRGVRSVILAVVDQTDPETAAAHPHLWVSLGQVGRALAFFKSQGVRQLVMAGKFHRPSLGALKLDWKGTLWLSQLPKAGFLGDDTLLRFLAAKFEAEGFHILSPQQIQKPLLEGEGVLTQRIPSEAGWQSIHLGLEVLRTLSPLDMGQAVVMQGQIILGVEGVEGTDSLIQRCGTLARRGEEPPLLVKGAKVHQDIRLDFPGLGPETVTQAIQAGLQGIAFEAGRALLMGKEEMVERADGGGIFLVGAPPG